LKLAGSPSEGSKAGERKFIVGGIGIGFVADRGNGSGAIGREENELDEDAKIGEGDSDFSCCD
jgi:hypothetical protein